ncbi:MAG: cytochrome c [Candidatus Rokubacteria bacterium]|nr:cytochrome c [Candidatus Rokubacteria bacterium]
MRRSLLVLVTAIAALGLLGTGLAWFFDRPPARPGAPRAERLWIALCADCHGADGRGSWRATLFLIRPGDLTDGATTGRQTDQYLVDIVKDGGSPIGRPGMPAFGAALTAEDIRALVAYVRGLARAPRVRGSS